ncbi:phage tail protein [Alterisphingorhabdus coralli]|uniref:Phage tail protein n=1 Tax=Alterisphingorhabdus coralli TaxID=3071408 RepID=A0AA97F816_9SPHN|nr:phage tail protein [Parasphingorhabdus sp. SCSIO 66989]WOE75688.1 phage tail protein [Parasphingorhabdus sp. SCSIO 66989]
MATLVLSAVGQLVGGPVGSAVGALLGNRVDNMLFGGSQKGPRLADLSVQTSQYGAIVPRIYGQMRVAGTVIWATDLVEHRERTGGGKGRPSQTHYTYSVSFAVALSSRPIASIGRIWADGNLLRGVNGDFKTETGFRLHNGFADQPVDPLIAGTEGAHSSPAYRDYAYCVFEDFDLTEYGNRIPSLTFEVIAGDEKFSPVMPISDFPDADPDMPEQPATITGYAIQADSWRGAIEELMAAFPMHADWRASGLYLLAANTAYDAADSSSLPMLRSEDQLLDSETADAAAEQRDKPKQQAETLILRYYEPERDFQAGLRRSVSGLVDSSQRGRTEQLDLPAALTVDDAETVVQQLQMERQANQSERTVFLATIDPDLRPGQLVRLEDSNASWRIRHWALENIAQNESRSIGCRVDLVRFYSGAALPSYAGYSAGRSVQPADYPAGPIDWTLLDLPCLPNEIAYQPRLFVAAWSANGEPAGWRHADIFRATADGGLLLSLGRVRNAAITGKTLTVVPASKGLFLNRQLALEVDFGETDPQLESLDSDGLNAGRNVAMLGEEIIQFGMAEWVGDGRYRLSEIYRALGDGRGGETSHPVDTRLFLLDSAILPIDSQGFAADAEQHYAATSPYAPEPILRTASPGARALMPLAPVHLRHSADDEGNIALQWTRRDRHRPGWRDGAEGPMAELDERYQVSIELLGTDDDRITLGVFETDRPDFTITADMLNGWNLGPSQALGASIRQIGDYGVSDAASISLL